MIVTKTDRKPPPRPARKNSVRKRRPAPEVPRDRRRPEYEGTDDTSMHETEPEPDGKENSLRLDDAYERYETFKQSGNSMNRLSMASMDTTVSFGSTVPSPSPSFSVPPNSSIEQDSRVHTSASSHFLHFFGRRTPANDSETPSRPVISGPIPIGEKEPSTPNLTDSSFGTVCIPLVWVSSC